MWNESGASHVISWMKMLGLSTSALIAVWKVSASGQAACQETRALELLPINLETTGTLQVKIQKALQKVM